MIDVFILGIHATPVRNYYNTSFRELVRSAYVGALSDAGLETGVDIEFCYFSNFMADYWGQNMMRGQSFLTPLQNAGLFPRRAPIFNLEGGCASASLAVHSAWKDILSGQSDVSLAVGVEKMFDPSKPGEALQWMSKSESIEGREEWHALLESTAAEIGEKFSFGPGHSFTMDFYSLIAKEHMQKYGTTQEQIAHAASKNHRNSLSNPRAIYHFDLSVDEVLNDRIISWPLTRAMCSPLSDAAAAVILCSERYLESIAPEAQDRAVRICASAMAGGVFKREHQDDRSSVVAAEKAYKMSGFEASDIDVVELHDATSFGEIQLIEDLQLCKRGQGGEYTTSGATRIDGEVAVNPSGGLVARGHPIGATGIIMLNELTIQLRGEAGSNQVNGAKIALQENGGGLIGIDCALSSVMILEA